MKFAGCGEWQSTQYCCVDRMVRRGGRRVHSVPDGAIDVALGQGDEVVAACPLASTAYNAPNPANNTCAMRRGLRGASVGWPKDPRSVTAAAELSIAGINREDYLQ
jgi:hypothetical protein